MGALRHRGEVADRDRCDVVADRPWGNHGVPSHREVRRPPDRRLAVDPRRRIDPCAEGQQHQTPPFVERSRRPGAEQAPAHRPGETAQPIAPRAKVGLPRSGSRRDVSRLFTMPSSALQQPKVAQTAPESGRKAGPAPGMPPYGPPSETTH